MASTQADGIDPWYLANLICPVDGSPLRYADRCLVSAAGRPYPIVDGIPVMLVRDADQTISVADASWQSVDAAAAGELNDPYFIETIGVSPQEREQLRELIRQKTSLVDPVVSFLVAATNGNMYKHLIGRLKEYPIPKIRLPPGGGKTLLDVGCNWGRWCIAAAREEYSPVGIDPSLGAVLAADRVAKQLGVKAKFVVGDARFLPFKPGTFDVGFSYSVIQHFSRQDAESSIRALGSVLKPGGSAFVQMPTVFGVRCLYHQLRRGFSEGSGFDVRYWTIPALKRLFTDAIGASSVLVDCYFGIGLQPSDARFMPWHFRAAMFASEGLRRVSGLVPPLKYLADSVYVLSEK